jgi:hypothetical protein
MGGKNFGFPWKILQPANLRGGQKVCKKEGAKKIFNSSNFLQNLISKNPEYSPARQCSSLTPPPPHPPPHPFWAAICANWDFLAWNWNYHAVDINMGQGRSVRTSRVFCLDQW